ncbi:MAG: DUF6036 family nucleotidyltransferase [Acidobacteriota bacterium]
MFEPILAALDRGDVRYILVGGVAVVLHGHARLTADVDMVIDLDPAEARKAIAALVDLGMRARAPVDPFRFADPAERARWITEKGMKVFSFWDPARPITEVDIFAESPIPFDELWARSIRLPVGPLTVRVAAIEDLLTMKRQAGRPKDQSDVAALEAILRARGAGS